MSVVLFTMSFTLGLVGQNIAFAATTPSLGAATTYGILSSTYTNTSGGTTVNGDVGFTTGAPVVPAGIHGFYGSGAPYSTAGTNQGSALSTGLTPQVCTYSFPPGDIDLSTDTSRPASTVSVFTPGVYCITGAMAISGPLTLSGSGTYIFRSTGALTSGDSSIIVFTGVSACDVFWTPGGATTLGANTTFVGTDIDDSGVTVGANTTWLGRALAFNGTVTTVTDNITVPTCSVPPATLNVIKFVSGGTAIPSNFNLHVMLGGSDVATSPHLGAGSPGTSYSLAPGTYVVSEDNSSSYTPSFTGDCNSSGSAILFAGQTYTCNVTNTYVPPPVVAAPVHVSSGGGQGTYRPPATTTTNTITTTVTTNVSSGTTPTLPNTGFPPEGQNIPWTIIAFSAALVAVIVSIVVIKKSRA